MTGLAQIDVVEEAHDLKERQFTGVCVLCHRRCRFGTRHLADGNAIATQIEGGSDLGVVRVALRTPGQKALDILDTTVTTKPVRIRSRRRRRRRRWLYGRRGPASATRRERYESDTARDEPENGTRHCRDGTREATSALVKAHAGSSSRLRNQVGSTLVEALQF
jgi:hypothetical protein